MNLANVLKWDEDKHPRDAIGRFADGDAESISGDNFEFRKIKEDPRYVDPITMQSIIDSSTRITAPYDREGYEGMAAEKKTPALQQAVTTIKDSYVAMASIKNGLNVMHDYTGMSSGNINEYAAHVAKNPLVVGVTDYRVAALDAMLDKVKPIEAPLMVFRGVSGKRTVMDAYKDMTPEDFIVKGKELIGQVYTEANYISTSFSHGKATDFSSGRTILQINLPKGTKVLVPGQASAHPREYEAILKRGAKFKITGVSYTGDAVSKMRSKVLHVTLLEDDSQSIAKGDVDGHPFRGNQYTDATASPEFKEWFGGSKVVDDKGQPLRLFHGTTKDIEAFDPSRTGEKDTGWYGVGHYMTADSDLAGAYASYGDVDKDGKLVEIPNQNILPVYVSLQNPYFWPEGKVANHEIGESAAFTKKLIAEGYDGVIVGNSYYDEDQKDHPGRKFYEVVAFKPEQIKSAVGNNGKFDKKDKRITKLDLAAILKANPYHDEMGRFTFADGEPSAGWGKLSAGPNFISIGDKFTSSINKMKEAHRAEMAKQQAVPVAPDMTIIQNLIKNANGDDTYSADSWGHLKDDPTVTAGTREVVDLMQATKEAMDINPLFESGVVDYTGSASRNMNRILGEEALGINPETTFGKDGWSAESVRNWSSRINGIDGAFAAVPPSKEALMLYRGASLRRVEGLANIDPDGDGKWNKSLTNEQFAQVVKDGSVIGKVIEDPGFLSTSLKVGIANDFKDDGYMLRIKAPAGTKMLMPGNLSQHAEELEVILDRGNRMKIVGASIGEEGKLYGRKILDVELLPPVPKAARGVPKDTTAPYVKPPKVDDSDLAIIDMNTGKVIKPAESFMKENKDVPPSEEKRVYDWATAKAKETGENFYTLYNGGMEKVKAKEKAGFTAALTKDITDAPALRDLYKNKKEPDSGWLHPKDIALLNGKGPVAVPAWMGSLPPTPTKAESTEWLKKYKNKPTGKIAQAVWYKHKKNILGHYDSKKFDEDQHPRDSSGRFTDEQGGADTVPVAPGTPFLVYRLGGPEIKPLSNRNAGNSMGVADHLSNMDDYDKPSPAGGFGDTIHSYKVVVNQAFGDYETFNQEKGASYAKGLSTVGRRGKWGIAYSFPAGGDYTAEHTGSVTLASAREHLKEMGYSSFDESGTVSGGEAIRRAFAKIHKFEEDQHPRGPDGKFVEGSMSDDKGYSSLDRKIIDIKPDRTLQDPKAVFAIDKVIPNSRFVSYSNTPFFDRINAMQGTPNPDDMDIKDYVAAREKLFAAQPVVLVPLDKVVVTQHLVNKERIAQLVAEPETGGKKPIRAVRFGGETFILDGHHRVVANMKRKVKSMESNLVDLDKKATKALKSAVLAMAGRTLAQVLKFNPNHDEKGRFANIGDGTPGGGLGVPIQPWEKHWYQLPIEVEDRRRDTPAVSVKIKDLVATQGQVDPERVARFLQNGGELSNDGKTRIIDIPVTVLSYQGKKYLFDGHHRTVASSQGGAETIQAHVIDLDKEIKEHKKLRRKSLVQILKYNPYHDEWGKFTTAEEAQSQSQSPQSIAKTLNNVRNLSDPVLVAKADATDARIKAGKATIENADVFTPGERTEKDPLGLNTGTYTPERQKLHDKIIKEAVAEMDAKRAKDGEDPQMIILGGRGGSGKSSFTNGTINEFDPSKYYTLDPDALKAKLPGYEGWNAAHYHEESAHLADALNLYALKNRVNMLLDVTMKTRKNVDATLNLYKMRGYNIEGHYMYLPSGKAAQRALGRAFDKEKGRYVPIEVILNNRENEANFHAMKKYFKKWSFYTNDVPRGEKPKKKAGSK